MEQTHGTWGDRIRIFQNDSCLVTLLDLKPMQRCSWHNHRKTHNHFYVVDGTLGVKTDKGYTDLLPGHAFTVEPGIDHEFVTSKVRARVIEIAYVKYDESDIFRKRLGGPVDE